MKKQDDTTTFTVMRMMVMNMTNVIGTWQMMINKNEYLLIVKMLNKSLKRRREEGFIENPAYECGFYNGVEFALAVLEGRDVKYRTFKNEELA
jgi:hypothetical protein